MSRRDLLILGTVLAVAAALFALFGVKRVKPAYAVIYVHDVEYARVSLQEDQTIQVDQGDGKINVVTIDRFGVRMESSTCRNQLCVRQGTIDPASMDELALGNWIVCLPNGVTVELTTEASQ